MLFYGFDMVCEYADEKKLGKTFSTRSDSPRVFFEAVASINNALCEGGKKGRYIFICNGNTEGWQMAASFSEKEKVSLQILHELLESVLKNKGDVQSFSLSNLHEMTAADFNKALNDASNEHFFYRCYDKFSKLKVDYFHNDYFTLREELQQEITLTKKAAIARAKEILPDQSLIDELVRIYSDQNVRRFYGHPVHYKIAAGNHETAMEVVRLLTEALYSQKRLLGRRLAIISDIEEGCYKEPNLEDLFRLAAGTTIVIDLRGSNDEHTNYASSYEQVTEFFSDLVKRYHKSSLCIFLEHTDNPGFTPSLMAKVEEHVDIIPINEGSGNRKESEAYLRRLVKSADFNVMSKNEIKSSLQNKTTFTPSELYGIYNKFYKDALKNKLYRAYKTTQYVTTKKKKTKNAAYARLQEMIGLTEVKKLIDQIIAANKVQKMRSQVGFDQQRSALHMIFTGNPGSAKTSVARLLAEILKKEGILESGAFVECGRSDLVGKYVGWTAPRVKEMFRRARGGVLFIDEAYSLVDEKDGMYGDEAINTIVHEMENRRDNVIVIFAGYKEKMEGFLAKNEGLRSRIAFHVDFPDYNAEELTQILSLMAKERGYEPDEPILLRCRKIFQAACGEREFGNGRFVRNLLEQAILKQSQRIINESAGKAMTRKELSQLAPSDFDVNISNRYKRRSVSIGFM